MFSPTGSEVPSECKLHGKTTEDAMLTLYNELNAVLLRHRETVNAQGAVSKIGQSFLHHSNVKSVFHWMSCLSLLLSSVALFIAYGLQNQRDHWMLCEGVVLLMINVCNCYLEGWQEKLRAHELISRAAYVLNKIRGFARNDIWSSANYLSLFSPLAPAVTLQWTIRDGEVVNLPCAFLVRGDVMLLRPGQQAMVKCRPLEDTLDVLELKPGDTFTPHYDGDNLLFKEPEMRTPLTPTPFIVSETPYVTNLRLILEEGVCRPDSVLDNERYQLQIVWLTRLFIPVVLVLMFFVNILRYIFNGRNVGHWTDMVFVQQVHCILPLLGLVFPLMWRILEAFGVTRVIVMFNKYRHIKPKTNLEDGFDTESAQSIVPESPPTCAEMWPHFKDVLFGTVPGLARTANITHVLGNVTSLCCIEKKGILSWPNPTAEKVFFLTNKSSQNKRTRLPSSTREDSSESEDESNDVKRNSYIKAEVADIEYAADTVFEVLDLTQLASDSSKLQFDDPSWKRHLSSLKPLGLNILLNTCNLNTSKQYTQFADHVTCISQRKEGSVPVVNRRCFCELAKQIGFTDDATEIFQTQQVLGVYKQLGFSQINLQKNTSSSYKDRYLSSKSFIKHKTPIPNMFSVIAREINSGIHQLFSQGTADMILDSCTDYWDGSDIRPLSEADRKRILDFYQRFSMSSYCTAFSYRPMTEVIGEKMSGVYIEVPEDSHHIYPMMRSPTPSRSWDMESLDSRLTKNLIYYGSADSVILDSGSPNPIETVDECFEAQCNQVFIGLITMQYQAKRDVVHMIEKLEDACIRFVHFSKENELRSRVFSEKMGLEAGWNCHISLLSPKSETNSSQAVRHTSTNSDEDANLNPRCLKVQSSERESKLKYCHSAVKMRNTQETVTLKERCTSAPGAINLDTFQVKFNTGLNSKESSPLRNPLVCSDNVNNRNIDSDNIDNGSESSLFSNEGTMDPSRSLLNSSSEINSKQSSSRSNKKSVSRESSEQHRRRTSTYKDEEEDAMLKEYNNETEIENSLHNSANRGQGMDQSHVYRNSYDYRNDDTCSGGSYPASSHPTDNTDSVTLGLGLSNRAKLPKGIENVRPHIENVDNVPLLVSLFTDCNQDTTREMLQILQENGEVVCVVGSSASIYSTGSFVQADCSIALDPVYPQVCMKSAKALEAPCEAEVPSPMELSATLHSIPCSLSLSRDDHVDMIQLIAQARHHCMSIRNCFIFMLSCQLTLTLVQVLAGLGQLPPVMAIHHLLWLIIVAVPLLSITIMANPIEGQIMTAALEKNSNHVTLQSVFTFSMYYLVQYLPSVALCLICFSLTLNNICQKHISGNSNSTCHILMGNTASYPPGSWNGWYSHHQMALLMAQSFLSFQLLLYFVCTSVSSLYRNQHIWKQSPFRNVLWCIIVPIILVIQLLFVASDLLTFPQSQHSSVSLADIPMLSWILALVWPVLLLPLNELIKYRRVKLYVRHQKRARLDFGTKLGMNSPF